MRTMVLKAFVVPALLLLVNTSFAQDRISAGESREARRVAHTFTRRLQRTKDIAPLIDDYFAPNFLDGYLQGREANWFAFLDRDFAKQLTRAELRRYFIAELNWFYLGELYVFSKYSSSRISKLDLSSPKKLYPADVLRIFLSDPIMKTIVEAEAADEEELLVRTPDRLRSLLANLESAASLLRRHATRINAGRTPQYRETVSDWKARYQLYEPSLTRCEEKCFALPEGTRLIQINVPSIQLWLTRVRGQLRIVAATYLVE